jgi:hypothetical protein
MGEYKNWEESANQLMLKKHGVGIDDIPDMTWHEWFMDGWTIQLWMVGLFKKLFKKLLILPIKGSGYEGNI